MRFIFVPHPVIAMPPSGLREYIDGNDPSTGKPVIDGIIEALTKPVSKEELTPRASQRRRIQRPDEQEKQKFLEPNSEDNYQRIFYERGWTDGLPVVLPTEERVKRMLTGTSHSPDEMVNRSATVTDVAVIAVMAGAGPEHFPVLLAIASSNQTAIMNSTTPFASMVLVNGPIRKEIGMNSGRGAFSPLDLANSVIGRAWTLMAINWQNVSKGTMWSSQGNQISYSNMCVAENEERSVWTPFHVQKGFKADESVVSFFRGWSVLSSMGAAAHRSHGEEMGIQLKAFPALFSAATLIVDPLVARILKEQEGFSTKADYSRWLSQNVKMTSGRFWETDYIDMLMGHLANQGQEPYASWKKVPDDELIAPYNDPEQINIVVVGGETSPVWKASDFSYVSSVSVDKWR